MTYSTLKPLFVNNNKPMLVNSSNSTFGFYKGACHTNPGAEKKLTGVKFIYSNKLIANVFGYVS